jgi:hypothetical protein
VAFCHGETRYHRDALIKPFAAIAHFRGAIQSNAQYADPHSNLGQLLRMLAYIPLLNPIDG